MRTRSLVETHTWDTEPATDVWAPRGEGGASWPLPELAVGRHLLVDRSQLGLVLSLVSLLRLDRPLQLSLQR